MQKFIFLKSINCVLFLSILNLPTMASFVNALPVAAQNQNNINQEASNLIDMALTDFKEGKLNDSVEKLERALSLYISTKDRKKQAETLSKLAIIYSVTGDLNKAIVDGEKSLQINREDNDRLGEFRSLAALGLIYQKAGQYSQSLIYLQRADKFAELYPIPTSDKYGNLLLLSSLYLELNSYEDSLIYAKKILIAARTAATKNIDGECVALILLGTIYRQKGEPNLAVDYFRKAQEIAGKTTFKSSLHPQILNGLGSAYFMINQDNTGIKYMEQALEMANRIENPGLQATIMNNLGGIYGNRKQYKIAKSYLQRALEISTRIKDQRSQIVELKQLAGLSYLQGEVSEAIQQLERATQLQDSVREGLDSNFGISLFESQFWIYKILALLQYQQGKNNESLVAADRGRARVFNNLLINRLNPKKIVIPSDINIKQLQNIAINHKSTIVEYLWIPNQGDESIIKTSDLIIYVISSGGSLSVRKKSFPKSFDLAALASENHNEVSNLRSPSRIRIEDLRMNQDVRWQGDSDSDSSRRIVRIYPETNEVDISSLSSEGKPERYPISQLRLLSAPQERTAKTLNQLHQILIEPIADLLPRDTETPVIFIPDGALFNVPFAALQDNNRQYLIERHPIITSPSIAILAQTQELHQKNRQNQGTAVIVGNPLMPKYSFNPVQLEQLPNSEIEANDIAALYQTQALIGENATKPNVKRNLSQARVIYFAIYGFVNEREALQSGIALAPSPGDSGILTADEIFDLRLNADLIVLSACNTGRGKITGDGVIGLSRSFISAGTPSIVVSLWSVNDPATAYLMKIFYQEWQNGTKGKAQALRKAMLATKQKYPSPAYWGAMTLIGEN